MQKKIIAVLGIGLLCVSGHCVNSQLAAGTERCYYYDQLFNELQSGSKDVLYGDNLNQTISVTWTNAVSKQKVWINYIDQYYVTSSNTPVYKSYKTDYLGVMTNPRDWDESIFSMMCCQMNTTQKVPLDNAWTYTVTRLASGTMKFLKRSPGSASAPISVSLSSLSTSTASLVDLYQFKFHIKLYDAKGVFTVWQVVSKQFYLKKGLNTISANLPANSELYFMEAANLWANNTTIVIAPEFCHDKSFDQKWLAVGYAPSAVWSQQRGITPWLDADCSLAGAMTSKVLAVGNPCASPYSWQNILATVPLNTKMAPPVSGYPLSLCGKVTSPEKLPPGIYPPFVPSSDSGGIRTGAEIWRKAMEDNYAYAEVMFVRAMADADAGKQLLDPYDFLYISSHERYLAQHSLRPSGEVIYQKAFTILYNRISQVNFTLYGGRNMTDYFISKFIVGNYSLYTDSWEEQCHTKFLLKRQTMPTGPAGQFPRVEPYQFTINYWAIDLDPTDPTGGLFTKKNLTWVQSITYGENEIIPPVPELNWELDEWIEARPVSSYAPVNRMSVSPRIPTPGDTLP